ncbi:MAG TPA: TadE family protein [Pirellulales bacterium]|nr:TadE family protein [Pirellulales bacterium]
MQATTSHLDSHAPDERRRGRKRPARHGTSAIEFAFVGPIVLLLFFGVLEIGRGLMVVHLLTNAARAGCRLGIIEGTSTTSITTAVKQSLTGVGISAETINVQVNDGATDASNSKAGDEITVKASIPTSSISWMPFQSFLSGMTLSGQYTLRRE